MFRKTILLWALATLFLFNTGCCRMWDRWCDRPARHYRGADVCCPPVPACPPHPCYTGPTSAPAPVDWRR